MKQYLVGEIEVGAFCDKYEQMWNFDREPAELDAVSTHALKEVFDVVVWYSPFEEDRRSVIAYKDEAAVSAAVQCALEQIDS